MRAPVCPGWSLALLAAALPLLRPAAIRAMGEPDPIFEKPSPITLPELARREPRGVEAIEVTDYAPGHYSGALSPSPPHADMNPRKAVVVRWKDSPCRFIFGHEASYSPFLELPSGEAMCDQFFEGNMGDAELFNNLGRKEKNSFVDVIESGPERVWVRWTYFAVNKDTDAQPRLRGTEDYFSYPNGLVMRRMTYRSMMPDSEFGYSTQPVELFGILPVGATLRSSFRTDAAHGDYNTLSALDLYSDLRYDIFWDDKGGVRRDADDKVMAALNRSAGCALVIPFREKLLFAVMGTASGFSPRTNQFVDHCNPGAFGGLSWGQGWWDHWPIGWVNSQGHLREPGSPYASHFGSIGQFFVPEGKRLNPWVHDYPEYCKDMAFNRWTESRVFYVLLGSADSWSEVRRIGRAWLDKGAACAKPSSLADLR
jgi:hypothetical protein